MTYSSNPSGTANLILTPEEHRRFKVGYELKHTVGDATGEFEITVKMTRTKTCYVVRNDKTKVEDFIYACNMQEAFTQKTGEKPNKRRETDKTGAHFQTLDGVWFTIQTRTI